MGRGLLVGEPVIRWLQYERSTASSLKFKVADSTTGDLQGFIADADIVITGVGKQGLIDPQWLKESAGIIDFGFPADMKQDDLILKLETFKLAFYTPTPGGTGPILVAKLFENMYRLCGGVDNFS